MDSIGALAGAVGNAVSNARGQARAATGQYSGGNVRVGNNGYRPVNAGDTSPAENKPVLCLIDGTNCYVVSDK